MLCRLKINVVNGCEYNWIMEYTNYTWEITFFRVNIDSPYQIKAIKLAI